MDDRTLLKPVLKWVGGKRQLLPDIRRHIPKEFTLYVEPFLGGGAVLLDRRPKCARVSDYNAELINVYEVVRDHPRELLERLRAHEEKNSSEHYYEIRSLDRAADFVSTDAIDRAARIIYLNKTCYNGLYRVNSAGQLNVPYGRYKHPNIVNQPGIMALSRYLNNNEISIACCDFAETLEDLPAGAFVYLDPPYMPLSESSAFTGYTEGGFDYDEQVRLRDECRKLRDKGILFLQSNSDCKEIRQLYSGFTIHTVKATRAINSRGDRRGAIDEVLISA